MHAAVSREEEVIEILVGHVVVHDLACGLFDVHVIRRIGQDQVCLLPVHEPGVNFLAGGVPADHPVRAEQPQVSEL